VGCSVEIAHFLATASACLTAGGPEFALLNGALHELYEFYGEHTGLRVAPSNHLRYNQGLAGSAHFPPPG